MDIHAYEPLWGRWKVEQLIGRGSYGSVYLCTRSEFGNVFTSAVKHISIPQDDEEIESARLEGMNEESLKSYFSGIAEDFISEIKLMNSLKGLTNVVSIEDYLVERCEDGVSWDILIRMEFLTSLNQYMQKHVLTQSEILQLGIDIAHAIVECQQSKVIHRDIKPDNIFVNAHGDFKLGDFGIARQLERTQASMSQRGTYSYMAPEIYLGRHYDARVDIYSLGLVLYQLLNGNRLPFLPAYPERISHRDHEAARSRRLTGEDMPPPIHADAGLSAVVLKACAHDPDERYATPGELRVALETALAGCADSSSITIVVEAQPQDAGETKNLHWEPAGKDAAGDDAKGEDTIALLPNLPKDAPAQRPPTEPTVSERPAESPTSKPPEPTPAPKWTKWCKAARKWLIALAAVVAIGIVAATVMLVFFSIGSVGALLFWTVLAAGFAVEIVILVLIRRRAKRGSWVPIAAAVVIAIVAGTVMLMRSSSPARAMAPGSMEENAVTISAGPFHTVGIKSDGTVVATGDNSFGQCDVSGWTDIVAIMAGWFHTIGLKGDGTVVATGRNEEGQCDVSGWADIAAIAAMGDHTVGLKSDGTVLATGDNDEGQCDVSGWADIVSVAAGTLHTVGIRRDGTVVATGRNEEGQCDVSGWADIVSIAVSNHHTVGLKRDGTAIATGRNYHGECDVAGWIDIVAIAVGNYHTVGLKSNGTVVATGSNGYGQCDVIGWTNIVSVATGWDHTIGLKSDGTVVATGWNSHAQCDVSGWTDIRVN